ncbi:hypothetical protein E3N88_14538 [Mikania micrantha]|uniref:Dehydrin n=1 Tax=Mikania micrantha TaxID=192012 RepID=A0A5N6P300_9ASTR|nr:hypothetical protein E3N88_14538 [Mikania micrantha]
MAGIMNKIGDALHIGGNKDDDKKHEGEHQKHEGECAPDHKKHEGGDSKTEHKEGIIDKIKDKIHGEDGGSKEECED